MSCSPPSSPEVTTKKSSSRKARPRFIRKVTCPICGDVANDHLHYGAIACYSCRAFFRRSVAHEGQQVKYECRNAAATRGSMGKCEITKSTRKNCQKCRFDKCVSAGMCAKWVLSEEEKMEKKTAMMNKMRVRRNIKKEAEGKSNQQIHIKSEGEDTDIEEMQIEDRHRDFPIQTKSQPRLTFTMEERNFMSNLAHLETLSRHYIQLSPETILALRESAILGTATPYNACMSGYDVCVQRIKWFMSHVDPFTDLTQHDKQLLIKLNTQAAVSIKAARMLRPCISLQSQLTCAVGKDTSLATIAIAQPHTNTHTGRISYSQIFPSPWCNSESTEQKFRRNMEDLFESNLDDHSVSLLVIIVMLSTSGNEHLLKDVSKIQGLRKGFLKLLHDYLKYVHGEATIRKVFPKYIKLLSQLQDMADVLEHHRLIF